MANRPDTGDRGNLERDDETLGTEEIRGVSDDDDAEFEDDDELEDDEEDGESGSVI